MKYLDVWLIFSAKKPQFFSGEISLVNGVLLIEDGVEFRSISAPNWSEDFIFYDWLRTFEGELKGVRFYFSKVVPEELVVLIPAVYREINGNAVSIFFGCGDPCIMDSDDQILAGGNEFFSQKILGNEVLAISLSLPL